jgi:hypothetical protein
VINKEREKPSSKMLITLKRALDSLNAHPLRLANGKEATKLKYIGP